MHHAMPLRCLWTQLWTLGHVVNWILGHLIWSMCEILYVAMKLGKGLWGLQKVTSASIELALDVISFISDVYSFDLIDLFLMYFCVCLKMICFVCFRSFRGKLTVFTVLCEQYQPSLKRDPMYNEVSGSITSASCDHLRIVSFAPLISMQPHEVVRC